MPRLDAAETFLWLNARLIERLRFSFLFNGGDAGPALAAAQGADGGWSFKQDERRAMQSAGCQSPA
jgi:hypothetical protein